jgi:RND family efflux transporter MFP subunit
MAQTDTLRVYVNVPEEFSQAVQPGQTKADIVLAEFPGRRFPGKLVRTADEINMSTRTLLVEVDVANPKGTLFTGSYAEVHLKVPAQNPTYLIPANTLLFRTQNLQVGVVQNGKVVLKNVTPGHDLGSEIEVIAGLNDHDQVIVNPSDSLVSGEAVQIVNATLPGDNPQ